MSGPIRRVAAWPVLCALVSAGYLATLGWDNERDLGPDGHLTGPWEAWQVAVLVLVLAAITVTAQVRGARLGALVVVPATVTGWWIWSVLRQDDGGVSFWPIGAAMVFAGTAGGVVLSEKAMDRLRTAPPGRRLEAAVGVVAWVCFAGALAAAVVGAALAFALVCASIACFAARSLMLVRAREADQ